MVIRKPKKNYTKYIFIVVIVLVTMFLNISSALATKHLDKEFLRKEIFLTLKGTGLYTRDIHNLLLGTAASESDFGFLNKQVKGPAVGIFQMEPATHNDIWEHWIGQKPKLKKHVEATMWKNVPKIVQLRYNLNYQIIMAAVHYHRINSVTKCLDHKKFKDQKDYKWWLAWVHKKVYNTKLGKSTTTRYFEKYNEYVFAI